MGLKQVLKDSFLVAKKNKWLWIYGILAASGTSYNVSRSISSQDIQNLPTNLPVSLSGLERVFTTWTSQLNPTQIGLFFGSVSILAIFGAIIAIIVTSWAEAAIIHGANEASKGTHVDLKNTSPVGLSNLRTMIAFKIISALMAIAVLLAIALPTLVITVVLIALKVSVAAIIIGVVAAILSLWAMIALFGTSLYGPREIVLKNYSAWNAWKNGFKMGRVYAIKTLFYGFIVGAVSAIITFVGVLVSLFILGLPAYFIVAPLITGSSQFSLVKILPLPLIALVFVWFNAALGGAVSTFRVTYWNHIFEKLWKEK